MLLALSARVNLLPRRRRRPYRPPNTLRRCYSTIFRARHRVESYINATAVISPTSTTLQSGEKHDKTTPKQKKDFLSVADRKCWRTSVISGRTQVFRVKWRVTCTLLFFFCIIYWLGLLHVRLGTAPFEGTVGKIEGRPLKQNITSACLSYRGSSLRNNYAHNRNRIIAIVTCFKSSYKIYKRVPNKFIYESKKKNN